MSHIVVSATVDYLDDAGVQHAALAGAFIEPAAGSVAGLEAAGAIAAASVAQSTISAESDHSGQRIPELASGARQTTELGRHGHQTCTGRLVILASGSSALEYDGREVRLLGKSSVPRPAHRILSPAGGLGVI